jgi:gamma-glutamylcyclotransferase (GGCT)/AIG2-like uncharacterized protein YtfP
VFLYGSLMEPTVVAALLGRTPVMTQAVLQDHHRYRIMGRVYPGMRPKPGSSVVGIIMEITPREAVVFDLFEDTDYDKQVRSSLLYCSISGYTMYAMLITIADCLPLNLAPRLSH